MRTDCIPPDDRAGTGVRSRRVEPLGPGTGGGPDAPAPGGATRRALLAGRLELPRTSEGSGPRAGRGHGSSRPSSWNSSGDEVEIGFKLPNNTVVIPALLARLHERAARFVPFDDNTADRAAVALTEVLVNGIQHGNLELDSQLRQEDEAAYDRIAEFRRRRPPYRDRRLHIRARLTPREAVYRIRDEGPGFDPTRLPDPTHPAQLERPTGRGMVLIRAFMDEVAFNGAGNQITLLKRRTTIPNARGL